MVNGPYFNDRLYAETFVATYLQLQMQILCYLKIKYLAKTASYGVSLYKAFKFIAAGQGAKWQSIVGST